MTHHDSPNKKLCGGKRKSCRSNQTRNPKTGRCRLLKSVSKARRRASARKRKSPKKRKSIRNTRKKSPHKRALASAAARRKQKARAEASAKSYSASKTEKRRMSPKMQDQIKKSAEKRRKRLSTVKDETDWHDKLFGSG